MTATPTYKDIIGKRLAAQTKRNYESSIKQMREKLSESEKEEYLDSNGYLVKPLNHEVAARILHDSQLKVAGEGEAAIQKMKSQSCCVLYSSAMKFWHTESNRARDTAEASPIIISEDLKVHLSSYNTGRRRMTAEDRAKGDDIECEGKLPLDFDDYKALARAAICSSKVSKEARLNHSYLLLCWNLIARSSTVAGILWNNISWLGDCLTVLYEKGKTNQEGQNKVPYITGIGSKEIYRDLILIFHRKYSPLEYMKLGSL